MNQNVKKTIAIVSAAALLISGAAAGKVQAAKKVKLNKTSVTLAVGKTVKLKLKNAKKKVKWSSKNKAVATVNKKGKVTAKTTGKAKIVAKSAGKKYTCVVKVVKKGTSTNNSSTEKPSSTKKPSTSTPKPSSTKKPSATDAPGTSTTDSAQTKPSNCEEDTLGVGNLSVKLGMSKSEVESSTGAKPDRQEKAPTGYDVYIYNPSADYTNYLMLQFDGNTLVGISTISAYFCYENLFSAGDSADSLTSAGFTSMEARYDYEEGYLYEGGNEYAMAFVDHQGSKQVYAAQIFSKTKELDDLFKAENLAYDDTIVSYMQQQLYDWVNAFRVYKGLSKVYYCNKSGAQDYSKEMAVSGTVAQASDWKQRFDNNYKDVLGLGEGETLGKAQNLSSRSPDAFGFVTWWVDDTDSADSSGIVKNYTNICKATATFDTGEEPLTAYYLCTGFAYNTSQRDVTFATLDFFY